MTTNGNNQETEEGNRPQNRRLTGSAIAPGLAEGKAFTYRDILSHGEAVSAESTPQIDVEHAPVSAAQHIEDTHRANRTLIEAIAKGHLWQAQLESGEYASLEDLAKDVGLSRWSGAKRGCDRTYVGCPDQPRAGRHRGHPARP